MWYAVKTVNGRMTRFDHDARGEFETRERLETAIEAWKKRVTPAMVAATEFEVFED